MQKDLINYFRNYYDMIMKSILLTTNTNRSLLQKYKFSVASNLVVVH